MTRQQAEEKLKTFGLLIEEMRQADLVRECEADSLSIALSLLRGRAKNLPEVERSPLDFVEAEVAALVGVPESLRACLSDILERARSL